jgi:hypothetical protein
MLIAASDHRKARKWTTIVVWKSFILQTPPLWLKQGGDFNRLLPFFHFIAPPPHLF